MNVENVEKLLVLSQIFVGMKSFTMERDPIDVTNARNLSVGAQALLSIRVLTESRELHDANWKSHHIKTRTYHYCKYVEFDCFMKMSKKELNCLSVGTPFSR